MTTNIVINGILGRMGREITDIVISDKSTDFVGCIERSGRSAIGKNASEYIGSVSSDLIIRSSFRDLNCSGSVIIDFTSPESTISLLQEIKGTNNRIVIGTTGLSENDLLRVKDVAETNAVFFSPNMSLGVNFLFYLTQIAAEKLGDNFDIEIIEAHHKFKKDSPSGTARRLGEIAAKAIGQTYEDAICHRKGGIIGERTEKEIGMHAVRGGDIVGDHTVLFAGMGERIELKHVAHSRATFAKGAVTAAKWLCSKEPGLYSMRDVLGF